MLGKLGDELWVYRLKLGSITWEEGYYEAGDGRSPLYIGADLG